MSQNTGISEEQYQARIFALLIDMGNKMQVLTDRELGKQNVTTRQWFLCLVLEQSGGMLSLGEAAAKMGTSHQNAKQLALKLERRGFLKIEAGMVDRRTLFLSLTEACRDFWRSREQVDQQLLQHLFAGMTDLNGLFTSLSYLHSRVHHLLGVHQDPFFIAKKELQ